ncbi:hypothetical protein DFJ74DRAFT_740913 [Hyaloraphidium curvatum]|nr:hypothetical protein DFJ74DRAFT_740913 [Hyaloraphidium curvatum]
MARAALIAALWALAAALLAVCAPGTDAQVAQNSNAGTAWVRAQTCCANCSYSNKLNCCCPRREPLTITRYRTATRSTTTTITTSQTARRAKLLAARGLPAEGAAGSVADLEARSQDSNISGTQDLSDVADGHSLEARAARHLCPPCPAGVRLRTSGSNAMPCCPARPTTTRTRTRTRTVTATRTYCPPGFGGPGCPRCPAGSISAGGIGATCARCPSGLTNADRTACVAQCRPSRTRCDAGIVCGTQPDGCGGQILCGVCASNQACSPDGTSCTNPDVNCVPKPACDVGLVCGIQSDGCGGILTCGNCDNSTHLCNIAGTVCQPLQPPGCIPEPISTTCTNAGRACGTTINNCGLGVSCGTCPFGTSCSSSGQCESVCVPATTCPSGLVCGTSPTGCGGSLICGVCPTGQTCAADGKSCLRPVVPCVPKPACTTQACGTEADGCGGFVNCPRCPTGQQCSATGTCLTPDPPCVPLSASAACGTRVCGTAAAGCGTYVGCGTCPNGTLCDTGRGRCNPIPPPPCVPITKCPAGRVCGTYPDGCGKLISCSANPDGSCPSPYTCAPDGTQCIPPKPTCNPFLTCAETGIPDICGTASDGCGGSLTCPPCPGDKVCQANKCVPKPVTCPAPSQQLVGNACVCAPGYYRPGSSLPLTCAECGADFYCPGGTSTVGDREPCPIGTGTAVGVTTATAAAQCRPQVCDPCPSVNPAVYFTRNSQKDILFQPAWNPANPGPAQGVCAFDISDPLFSGTNSDINDVAVTNTGLLLIAGRETNTAGYLLAVDPKAQVAGQPCKYTKLLSTPFVIAGFGASSKSDIFLGTGADQVFGYKIVEDPATGAVSATVIGSITSGLGGGAGDITMAPGRTDIAYIVDDRQAYSVALGADGLPVAGTITQLADGGVSLNAPGAWCTASAPFAGAGGGQGAYRLPLVPPPGTFTNAGSTGLGSGMSGAGTVPVCSRAPA